VSRPLTVHELAATIAFHDRYIAQRGGAVDFWLSLSAADQDLIDRLIRAVGEALTQPDPTWPQCPKRCDVATRPEYAAPGRWVCYGCGTEFSWPLDDDGDGDQVTAATPANVLAFPSHGSDL
jgi:hypothetical protein